MTRNAGRPHAGAYKVAPHDASLGRNPDDAPPSGRVRGIKRAAGRKPTQRQKSEARKARQRPGVPLLSGAVPASKTFDAVCAELRDRLQAVKEITEILIKDHFAIADLFAKAKKLYEETTGVGHGHRNPARLPSFAEFMEPKVGRDPSSILRYCRLAKADEKTRDLIAASTIRGNLTMLLEIVREPDAEVRAQAIAVYDEGGAKAAKAVLACTNPIAERAAHDSELVEFIEQFLDPKTPVGGIVAAVPETALPDDLVASDKEGLTAMTFGAVREAAGALKPGAQHAAGGKANGNANAKAKAVETLRAEGAIVDGVCNIEDFCGRRVQISITGDTLVITDEGEAPGYSPPEGPTTKGPALENHVASQTLEAARVPGKGNAAEQPRTSVPAAETRTMNDATAIIRDAQPSGPEKWEPQLRTHKEPKMKTMTLGPKKPKPNLTRVFERACKLYQERPNRDFMGSKPDWKVSRLDKTNAYYMLCASSGELMRTYAIALDGTLSHVRMPIRQCSDCGEPVVLWDVSECSESCETCMTLSGDADGLAHRQDWKVIYEQGQADENGSK